MKLLVIGISHKTAPVKVRERFSFTRRRLEESLAEFKNSGLVEAALILSTCNRTEVYAHVDKEASRIEKSKALVFDIFHAGEGEIGRYFYILEGVEALRHIFRVASGLDSQVLGETQILAQARSAWAIAKDMGTTSSLIDEVFKKALSVGGGVRAKTGISQGNISIGSVAIKMLEDNFKDLRDRTVLIIGAGKIGALISKYLKDKHIKGIFVSSRTYARAAELASNCGGRAVDFSVLKEELEGVDIVISSTSSPHIVLKKEMLLNVMRTRPRAGLFIMDLALPRDVDPAARAIDGITLRDLDDLKYVVEENHRKRLEEAVLAEGIVEQELNRFCLGKEDEGAAWEAISIEN